MNKQIIKESLEQHIFNPFSFLGVVFKPPSSSPQTGPVVPTLGLQSHGPADVLRQQPIHECGRRRRHGVLTGLVTVGVGLELRLHFFGLPFEFGPELAVYHAVLVGLGFGLVPVPDRDVPSVLELDVLGLEPLRLCGLRLERTLFSAWRSGEIERLRDSENGV